MLYGEGKFLRQVKGVPYAAKVSVKVDPYTEQHYITVECSGRGFYRQGSIEEVPSHGYEDWKSGAVIGAEFALKTCNNPGYGVIITKIEGMTTDTNQTIVAVAAAYSVWDALSFKIDDKLKTRLEEIVFNSWNLPPGEPKEKGSPGNRILFP